jgi:VIT1/CCC1 family predicted Fe2+/Mn2+ transporter
MAEAAASPGRSECAAADEPNSPLSGQRSHAAQQSEALGSRVESLHSRIDALLERARSPVEDGDERAHGDGDLEEEEEEEEDQEVKRSRDGRDGSLEAALHALPRSPAAQRRERDLKQLREPDSDAEALLAELGVAKAPAGIGSNRTRPLRARPAALDAAAAPRVSERALGAAKHPHFMRGEHIADAVAMQRIR